MALPEMLNKASRQGFSTWLSSQRIDPLGAYPADRQSVTQQAILEWKASVADLFTAEVSKRAASLVEERLAGPYTHRYKGVAVTEEQFWLLMKAEGFERPEVSA